MVDTVLTLVFGIAYATACGICGLSAVLQIAVDLEKYKEEKAEEKDGIKD